MAVKASLVWPDPGMFPPAGYSNIVSATHTPWDFVLGFGSVTPPIGPPPQGDGESHPVEIRPVAAITLSPLAAQQLYDLLGRQLKAYSEDRPKTIFAEMKEDQDNKEGGAS